MADMTGDTHGPSFADGVVHLNHDQATLLHAVLSDAIKNRLSVHVALDEGGLKVKTGNGTWTPALGTLTP